HPGPGRNRRLRRVSRVAGQGRPAVLAAVDRGEDRRHPGEGAVRAALAVALLLATAAFAVRPVAKASKGRLEDRAHPQDVIAALAEFEGTRPEAMAAVQAAARDVGLNPDAILVGLLQAKSKLLACYPDGPRRARTWLAFASSLSKQPGVARAWAF